MTALARGWDRFWFRPQPTSTLALLRVAYGLLVLVWTVPLAADAGMLFGPRGVTAGEPAAPAVVALLAAAGACLTAGYRSRLAAATVFFCAAWLHRVNPLVWNTGDVLLRHVALFLALAPAGDSFSVDRVRRRAPFWEFPARAPWALRLLQIQLAIVYVVAFTSKLDGSTWRAGTAVSYVLRLPGDVRWALPLGFTTSPGWMRALTWGTLALEAAIPVLVWNRRARPYVLAAGVALHLAIHLTMRVGLFSWTMAVAYLAFVPPATAERLLLRLRRAPVAPRPGDLAAGTPGATVRR